MKWYRIIKQNENGKISFFIQRQILPRLINFQTRWGWVNCKTKVFNGTKEGYLLEERVCLFPTMEKAILHLHRHHFNSFKKKYKGNKIEARYCRVTGNAFYFNISKPLGKNDFTYEGYEVLSDLEKAIDKRANKFDYEQVNLINDMGFIEC